MPREDGSSPSGPNIVDQLTSKDKVFIFSKSYCPFCVQVKKLFTDLNVAFGVIELDIVDNGELIMTELVKKTGQSTVPSVFIQGNHVGGCDSTLKAQADGSLAVLLGNSPPTHGYDFDLVVIGGGSGGLAASKEAAQFGKKVAVCDFVNPSPIGTTWGLGGTCVNVGCIPKKLMHQAALLGKAQTDAPHFGWSIPGKVEHNWVKMVDGIQNHIKSLNWGYRVSLQDKNVKYINSYARFIDTHTVKLTDKKGVTKNISAQTFIVAVGGRPTYPIDVPGALEYGITSDDLFSLPQSPGKTLLIGASYIALECAGFLAGFGLDVTVMVRSILLRGFDRQMSQMIGAHMITHGVKFIEECIPNKIEKLSDGPPVLLKVTATAGGKEIVGEYNTVVFAIGRKACTNGIGLTDIGIQLQKNNEKIIGDEKEQSSVKNVFAIGDVLDGTPELTPVAIQAGKRLAQRLYGKSTSLTDYTNVATTVFTPLEYGCVGLSEEAAITRYGAQNIEVYHSHLQPLEFSLPGRDLNMSYGKLICVKNDDERVVGFHYLGPNAGEITQGFAIGLKLGARKADFNNLIGIHPTCAEVFTGMNTTKASGVSVDKSSC